MHFDNLKAVLRVGADPSSQFKLATAAAVTSRPWLRPAGLPLLRMLASHEDLWVRYRREGTVRRCALRLPNLSSDLQTFYETGSDDCYRLPRDFQPEVVIDGGANLGLFTLYALSLWPACKVIACEPEPENLRQLSRHLNENGAQVEVVAACLGGSPGSARFYCREANRNSFDPSLPFSRCIDVPVTTLSEICRKVNGRRCLVKLDIEGAELEVLAEFLAQERPNFYVVGELHSRHQRKTALTELVAAHGWQVRYFSEAHECAMFHAWPCAGEVRH